MSRAFRPWAANKEIKVLRLAEGGGRLVLAALWLAVLASFLPNGTGQEGPPNCIINHTGTSILLHGLINITIYYCKLFFLILNKVIYFLTLKFQ